MRKALLAPGRMPYAYSYVDDDATSVFTCKGRCDYQITFGISPPG